MGLQMRPPKDADPELRHTNDRYHSLLFFPFKSGDEDSISKSFDYIM